MTSGHRPTKKTKGTSIQPRYCLARCLTINPRAYINVWVPVPPEVPGYVPLPQQPPEPPDLLDAPVPTTIPKPASSLVLRLACLHFALGKERR